MPRYFFDVFDERELIDQVGADHDDLSAARQEALKLATDVMTDRGFIGSWSAWRLSVRDETGAIVFSLRYGIHDEGSSSIAS